MRSTEISIAQSLANLDRQEDQARCRDQVADGIFLDLSTYGRATYTVNANTLNEKSESIQFEELIEDLDDRFVSALFRYFSTANKTNQLGHAAASRELLALLNQRARDRASEAASEVVK